jgi:hypothetical protein
MEDVPGFGWLRTVVRRAKPKTEQDAATKVEEV